uniref:methyl-accepting chemotaxis protein n=1 Tax=uncultured Allobacillus sp. TaxID=1638025 RepID=UPI002595D8C5|nr:methyl-accepting chemotaxis protein [uncultured Allobacillus sp.]
MKKNKIKQKRFKRFKDWSIRTKLLSTFLTILLIPTLLVGISSYNSAKEEISAQVMNSASTNIEVIDEEIDQLITQKSDALNYLATVIHRFTYNKPDELKDMLSQYLLTNKDTAFVYVGTEEGDMYTQPAMNDSSYDPTERDWYIQAMESPGEVIVTPPYQDADTENMVVTVAQATNDQSGVVGIDVKLEELETLANTMQIGEEGYVILIDQNNQYLSHPTEETGSPVTEAWKDTVASAENGQESYMHDGESKEMIFDTSEKTGWKIVGTMYTSEFDEAASGIWKTTLVVMGVAIAISIAVILFVTRQMTVPLKDLTGKVHAMSKGDLTVDIETQSKDEIGQLSAGVKEMQQNLKTLIGQVQQASGNLAAQSEEMTQSAGEVKEGSEQIAATMEELASGGETQASSAGDLSTTMESFTERMTAANANSDNAYESSKQVLEMTNTGADLMKQSVSQMEYIDKVVQSAVEKMGGLNDQTEQISELVSVIRDIADQTNLLALNAAIEAARAGEHGKGFAVVADEVRKLAEQVGSSVTSITGIVNNVQTESTDVAESLRSGYAEVEKGREQIEQTGTTFQKIETSIQEMTRHIRSVSDNITTMTSNTDEMNASIQEIAAVSEESAAGIEEAAASAQQSSSSMEEVTRASEELAKLAEELTEQVKRFKV